MHARRRERAGDQFDPVRDGMLRLAQINVCYPEEIVRYYSPNYAQGLLQKLETYTQ